MPLPRLQLFELLDLAWFPRTIRDLATDYLHFMETRFTLHEPVVPLLRAMLEESKTSEVVDLCSGGGGPVLDVYESLVARGTHVRITLTDKYPNLDAFGHLSSLHPSGILYIADSVDATKAPRELIGLRTMFNAFHHFAPREAHSVLECAVQAGQPICIFEMPERSLIMMVSILVHASFCSASHPLHTAIPMEALALDLRDSVDSAYVLVGWSGLPMSRLHCRRNVGSDSRSRRFRLESGSRRHCRESWASHLPTGGYAVSRRLMLTLRRHFGLARYIFTSIACRDLAVE